MPPMQSQSGLPPTPESWAGEGPKTKKPKKTHGGPEKPKQAQVAADGPPHDEKAELRDRGRIWKYLNGKPNVAPHNENASFVSITTR